MFIQLVSLAPSAGIMFPSTTVCGLSSRGVLSGGERSGCSKPDFSGGALTRRFSLTPSSGTLDDLTVVGDTNNFVIDLDVVLGFTLELELFVVEPLFS